MSHKQTTPIRRWVQKLKEINYSRKLVRGTSKLCEIQKWLYQIAVYATITYMTKQLPATDATRYQENKPLP